MIFLFYSVAVFITLHYNHMYIHQIIIELQLLQLLPLIYYIIITRIYLAVYIIYC
jgi:hypothetical protein